MELDTNSHFLKLHPKMEMVSSILMVLIINLARTLAQFTSYLLENGILFSLFYDTVICSIFGLLLALIWIWLTWHWRAAVLLGLGAAAFPGLFKLLIYLFPASSLIDGLHGGVENAMLFLLLFGLPCALARRIANPWAGIIAGLFGGAGAYIAFVVLVDHYPLIDILPPILLALMLGISFNWWRALLCYPLFAAWNLLLYRYEEQRSPNQTSLLRWHSAFWDEYQHLQLSGLDSYVVLLAERDAEAGEAAISQLSDSRQSWAARAARIELDARRLKNCQSVSAIAKAHHTLAAGELRGPASTLLRSFSRISHDVEVARAQENNYSQRLAMAAAEDRVDALLRDLTRSNEPYASRFYPVATHWQQLITAHLESLREAAESRQEISNPYIIGIPLTEHQEIFVGRSDISERLEKLLLGRRCPPLLLYGQRRTGKTSLLNNLGRLLPGALVPLFVDLQGPASLAKDYEGFLYNLARAMITSAKRHRDLTFPPLTRERLREDPFTCFDEWLDEVEQVLSPDQTVLLASDEFSALDHVIRQGRLDEAAILGMFRHIIQHRPRFKILLSGSHTLDEFERWASYLINVQTVHISYLQTNEAQRLIKQPVSDFALRYEDEASQRVMEITRCHPALIQLLCSEIVTLKNRQHISERRLATVSDVEAAAPGALQHGRFFFADISNNQITAEGLAILRLLATAGEGGRLSANQLRDHSPEHFEKTITLLQQRELIEKIGDSYQFQVELIRRWFV